MADKLYWVGECDKHYWIIVPTDRLGKCRCCDMVPKISGTATSEAKTICKHPEDEECYVK